MEIEKSLTDGILRLALKGDFDMTETGYFSAEIAEAVEEGNFRVLLELSELEFINSTGLGTLLRSQKLLSQYGGELAATGASRDVAKTFRILQLDRRIPMFQDEAEAIKHLESIGPASVPGAGEEVEFVLPEREDVFGARPRRAKLEEIDEEGIFLAFENLTKIDPEAAFTPGTSIEMEFRLPLYHPTHVFQVEGRIERYEFLGLETTLIRCLFTKITDAERSAIRQYVKDLRFLKDD